MSSPGQLEKSKGTLLKEARQAQGISLDAVHEATKIPMDVLKGIEEGYSVGTISQFYLKGFLKMYAKFLGVDTREVLQEEVRPGLPHPIKSQGDIEKLQSRFGEFATRQQKQQMAKLSVVLVALLVLFGVFKGIQLIVMAIQKSRPSKVEKIKTSNSETIKSMIKKEKEKPAVKKSVLVKSEKVSEKNSAKQMVVTAEAKETKSEPKAAPAPVVESDEPQKDNIRLTIKPRKKVWLQVKVDGNVIFQSTLKEGVAESWEAEKEIELSGKDIHYLDFELNGKIMDLGRVDSNTRRVVITPQGLSVKK